MKISITAYTVFVLSVIGITLFLSQKAGVIKHFLIGQTIWIWLIIAIVLGVLFILCCHCLELFNAYLTGGKNEPEK